MLLAKHVAGSFAKMRVLVLCDEVMRVLLITTTSTMNLSTVHLLAIL